VNDDDNIITLAGNRNPTPRQARDLEPIIREHLLALRAGLGPFNQRKLARLDSAIDTVLSYCRLLDLFNTFRDSSREPA
jgi:hypothetical protein